MANTCGIRENTVVGPNTSLHACSQGHYFISVNNAFLADKSGSKRDFS